VTVEVDDVERLTNANRTENLRARLQSPFSSGEKVRMRGGGGKDGYQGTTLTPTLV